MADAEKKLQGLPEEPRRASGETWQKAETRESKPSMPEAPPVQEVPSAPEVQAAVSANPTAPLVTAEPKDELTAEIEDVLSEDLGDLYKTLSGEKKREFKAEGEKTAGIIRKMIAHGKFHGHRILGLIVKWLKLIPGVNKFFLEQESKIKVDKIMMLAEDENKKKKV